LFPQLAVSFDHSLATRDVFGEKSRLGRDFSLDTFSFPTNTFDAW
jgi:hypothetical protein